MTPKTLNDTMQTLESDTSFPTPASSAQALATTGDITEERVVEQPNPSDVSAAEQTEDGVEDDAPEAEADSSEVTEKEPTSESASNANALAAAQTSSTSAAKNEEDEDERSEIERQPYDFEQCTVQIAIQLLPDDGNPQGRMIVVGVRSHLDAPILRVVRLNELGGLPPIVNTLLDELISELPAREQAARAAFEKKREEKAKYKAELEASRARASQRSKRTKPT